MATGTIRVNISSSVFRGNLAAGSDFDTLRTPGVWFVAGGNEYHHNPVGAGYGMLEVLGQRANTAYMQRLTNQNSIFIRYYSNGWLPWRKIVGETVETNE